MAEVAPDAPLRAVLTQLLGEYRELVQRLLQATMAQADGSARAGKGSTAEEVMSEIIQKDIQVQAAVKALREHQTTQRKIALVQEAIRQQDAAIVQLTTRLKKAETALDSTLTEARELLKVIRRAGKAAVDPNDLVTYAGMASYTVAPPPDRPEGPLGPFSGAYPEDPRWKCGRMSLWESIGSFEAPIIPVGTAQSLSSAATPIPGTRPQMRMPAPQPIEEEPTEQVDLDLSGSSDESDMD
eukprot:comp19073_c0_seq1/m.21555 comp19073_c0_seq1/g.21555  ORF comp19073_c0_seq1/g.21555 comp19073_c0_seq1/m.21555 type:complete len:241 (-) comp19073_c0_seq1:422-1144(-)